jgi:CheY-like chemotaxis protein
MKVQSPEVKAARRTDKVDRVMARVDGPDLNATLRPGGLPPPKIAKRDTLPAGHTPEDPSATLRPGAPAPRVQRPGAGTPIDVILREIRTIRRTQEEILELLRSRGAGASAGAGAGADAGPGNAAADGPGVTAPPVPRSRGRHVLLVDDDADTAAAASAALESGSIDVKRVKDGNECLAAIGVRKPDVIVLEADLGAPMPGRDVVNMIKATMEWVDIPIVIFTRAALGDEEEALREFSADAIVAKAPGAELELAQQVGALLEQS